MRRAKIITFCILIVCVLALGLKFVEGFSRLQAQERKIDILSKKLQERARRITVVATAYTSTREECDDTPFITASGKKVFWGVIAADKKFPFGTKIYIPYFKKTFIVLDRGGAIKGNRIDIWMPRKKEAIKFGKKKLEVYVLGR